jgi:hypothetical protein
MGHHRRGRRVVVGELGRALEGHLGTKVAGHPGDLVVVGRDERARDRSAAAGVGDRIRQQRLARDLELTIQELEVNLLFLYILLG